MTFTVESSGDTAVQLLLYLGVYDAAGTDRQQNDLGSIVPGQTWTGEIDLPAASLEDGDYGAWLSVYLYDESDWDADDKPLAQQGVSFLVGHGRVYASTERAVAPTTAAPPKISALRLNGSWIVFDMTNSEQFDIEVNHELKVYDANGGEVHRANGRELVQPGATQQGHYLLPEGWGDGRYMILVLVSRAGSEEPIVGSMWIEVAGAVMTEVPGG